ncbi:MAG: response regulator, partial [Acidobacteriota bacterium]
MGLPSILLVDDDPSLRRVVEFQLAEAGYSVRSAGSAEEALEVLREEPADLILTDLLMPGMDGIALVERVRV